MPKPKSAPKPTVNFENSASEGVDMDAPDAIRAINAAAETEGGQDWEILVYRVLGPQRDGAKQPWLFNIEVDELRDLRMRLANLYPQGGKFRVVCRLNDRIFKQFYFEIEKRPGYSEFPSPATPAPASSAPNPPTDDRLYHMVENMQRENRAFMEAITARLTAPAPAAPDANAMLLGMMNTFKTFQELMPKPNPDLSLSLFEKGIELGTKFAATAAGARGDDDDGEGGGNGLVGLVRTFLQSDVAKGVAATMMQGPQPTPAPQPPAPTLANPRGQQQRPQQQQPRQPVNMFDPDAQIAAGMQVLMERAASGADPALAADWILDNVPETVLDRFDQQPDLVGWLASKYPGVNQNRAWFEALVENLREPEQGADGEGDGGADVAASNQANTGRNPGDARDTKNHAEHGP